VPGDEKKTRERYDLVLCQLALTHIVHYEAAENVLFRLSYLMADKLTKVLLAESVVRRDRLLQARCA